MLNKLLIIIAFLFVFTNFSHAFEAVHRYSDCMISAAMTTTYKLKNEYIRQIESAVAENKEDIILLPNNITSSDFFHFSNVIKEFIFGKTDDIKIFCPDEWVNARIFYRSYIRKEDFEGVELSIDQLSMIFMSEEDSKISSRIDEYLRTLTKENSHPLCEIGEIYGETPNLCGN